MGAVVFFATAAPIAPASEGGMLCAIPALKTLPPGTTLGIEFIVQLRCRFKSVGTLLKLT